MKTVADDVQCKQKCQLPALGHEIPRVDRAYWMDNCYQRLMNVTSSKYAHSTLTASTLFQNNTSVNQ